MDDDSVMEDDSIVEALGGDVASRDKASQNTKKDVGSRKKRGALVVVPRRRRDSAASAPRGKKLRGRGKAAHDMSSAPRSSKRASIEPERFGKQSKPETKLRSRKPVPPVPAAKTATPTTKKEKKFIVQKILDKKTMKRKVHYLVKWQGYPASQNTWELQETLRTDVPDLVNEFESKTKKGAATSESEPVRRGRGRPRVEPVEETVRVVDADRDSEDESLYYVIDRRGVKTRLSAEEARTNYPLALIDFYEQIVEFESD
ncbi:Chromobox protein 5 [Orchesella cincta]|uniref:Chromobox protein 5 n=1 Tax=Orchesella cincta TaxID=48709 RepID=A0A1D2MQF6_ORCCI|nr:Chromobox protein 5 [Orchesella cincta]